MRDRDSSTNRDTRRDDDTEIKTDRNKDGVSQKEMETDRKDGDN